MKPKLQQIIKIIDHTVNISNFIVKDYCCTGGASIAIEIISTETTTTSGPIVSTRVESSKNEQNEFSIFGSKYLLTDIILFGAIGELIILACCVIFAINCTCSHRKSAKVKC